MNRRIIPLIMCGGAGTRLWPASREVRPKQFLPLFGPRSTFQDTHAAGVGADAVRAADRHHQHRLSLHGAGAAGRDRARGRCPAGADAARIPARRSPRARPLRRARDGEAIVLALAADHVVARYRCLRRRLPPGSRRRRSRAHRHLRRAARACRPPNTAISVPAKRSPARSAAVAKFVEKPDPSNGCRIRQGGLSLEQRQLHVPRRRSARRIPQRRCRRACRPSPTP